MLVEFYDEPAYMAKIRAEYLSRSNFVVYMEEPSVYAPLFELTRVNFPVPAYPSSDGQNASCGMFLVD